MEDSISGKIIRNTIFNTIGFFWGSSVVLFLTPYIIGHIGVERYGIWAMVGFLTGYFGLLDFGIGTSFVKYISEFYTKKDYEKINQVVNTGFAFYLTLGVVIVGLSFLIIDFLLSLLNIPPDLYKEAIFVFLLGIMLFSISNALSVFKAMQDGLQRMDITNKVAIGISILMVIGTIYFLEEGYGLPGLMINNAIILIISSIINIVIAFKILPELRFSPLLFNKETFKKLFSFGYKLQVVGISSLAGPQTNKFLIAYFLNLSLVTFYQLADLILSKLKQLVLLITSALMPAVSELETNKDVEKIKLLYTKALRYVILIALPIDFFLIINAHLIILTWMNQDIKEAVLALQVLAIGFFVNTLTGPGAVTVQGIGKPEYQMKASLMHFILILPLNIILIIKFGFTGSLIGTSLAFIISGVYFIYLVNKELKTTFYEFIQNICSPFFACTIAGFLNYTMNRFTIKLDISSGRVINFSILLLDGFVFGSIFILVLFLAKYFDKQDISLLKRVFSPNLLLSARGGKNK